MVPLEQRKFDICHLQFTSCGSIIIIGKDLQDHQYLSQQEERTSNQSAEYLHMNIGNKS